MLSTHVGTPYYKAPEVYYDLGYDEKADLWSLGVILYQMVFGKLPFTAGSERELFDKIAKGSYPLPKGKVSDTCISLIAALLQDKPDKRMNYAQLGDHPFVKLEPNVYREYLEI